MPTTVAARDVYLARWSPSYPAYRLLNERKGHAYRLYQLYDEGMAYFADGVSMGDWFGPARYSRVAPALGDARALHRELGRLGADHFLVWLNRYGGGASLPADDFFRRHFRLLYASGPVSLYELRD